MRPPTIVNQPPIYLLTPDDSSATDTDHKLERVLSTTRQRVLQPSFQPFTFHTLSEFEPYTSSPIDRDDFLEDEPLFATDLSSFGSSITIYQFSSAHLANINRQDIIADHHGCARADIASSERTKPLRHGQRFKRYLDWDAIEKERSAQYIERTQQCDDEREEKQQERETAWQLELATWPSFVPYKGELKETFCPHHVWNARYCQLCAPASGGGLITRAEVVQLFSYKPLDLEKSFQDPTVDYLKAQKPCKEHNVCSWTFKDRTTITLCRDCGKTTGHKVLRVHNPNVSNQLTEEGRLFYDMLLRSVGLDMTAGMSSNLSYHAPKKISMIEHAQGFKKRYGGTRVNLNSCHTDFDRNDEDGWKRGNPREMRGDSGVRDYRANEIEVANDLKANTEVQRNCEGCGVLFVPNHASRKHCSDNCRKRHFKKKQGRPFPHTLTMHRAFKNFCPRCTSYEKADHECQGNALEQTNERRKQEHNRKLRDANITLSNPNALAQSKLLALRGGYEDPFATK